MIFGFLEEYQKKYNIHMYQKGVINSSKKCIWINFRPIFSDVQIPSLLLGVLKFFFPPRKKQILGFLVVLLDYQVCSRLFLLTEKWPLGFLVDKWSTNEAQLKVLEHK